MRRHKLLKYMQAACGSNINQVTTTLHVGRLFTACAMPAEGIEGYFPLMPVGATYHIVQTLAPSHHRAQMFISSHMSFTEDDMRQSEVKYVVNDSVIY